MVETRVWNYQEIIKKASQVTEDYSTVLGNSGSSEFSNINWARVWQALETGISHREKRPPHFIEYGLKPLPDDPQMPPNITRIYQLEGLARPYISLIAHVAKRRLEFGERTAKLYDDLYRLAEIEASSGKDFIQPPYCLKDPKPGGVVVVTIDLFYSDKLLVSKR